MRTSLLDPAVGTVVAPSGPHNDILPRRLRQLEHPSHGAIRGTLNDVRSALQRAVDNPHGDAADAEVASKQFPTLMGAPGTAAGPGPEPADLMGLEDKLDWVCGQLVRAAATADPR